MSIAASLMLLVAAPVFADTVPTTPGTPAPAGDYNFSFYGTMYNGMGTITTDASGHITGINGNVTDLSTSVSDSILGISSYASADNNLYITPAYVTFMGISFSTAILGDFNLGNTLTGDYAIANSITNPGGNYPGAVDQPVTVNIAAVPEPASWAMMLLGFAGVGAAMRRTRRAKPVLAQLA